MAGKDHSNKGCFAPLPMEFTSMLVEQQNATHTTVITHVIDYCR